MEGYSAVTPSSLLHRVEIEPLQMIVILVEYYCGLTMNSTLFLITLTCLGSFISTKKSIRLNEDYWDQNLWRKEMVSKTFFLTSLVLSARRDLSSFN